MKRKTSSKLIWIFGGVFVIYCIVTFLRPARINLGDGYYFEQECKVIFSKTTLIFVDPYVVDYNYNSDYIIAKQKLPDIKHDIYDYSIYPNDIDNVFYYIINKKSNSLHGPLDSTRFYSSLKQMNIDLSF